MFFRQKNIRTKEKFIFIDRQPAERIPELLTACDVAFVSFMNSPLFEKTIPAKLQSYMACGMPILASASGETKRIIEDAKCGVCCELGSAEETAKAIQKLKDENLEPFKQASIDYYMNNFEKEKLMEFVGEEIC